MSDYLTNPEEDTKVYQPRYKLIYLIVIVSSLILVGRLWYLQVNLGEELRHYSERNRVKETRIPAPRGLVFDRNNEVLVENLRGFEVTISPQYATELEATAEAVGMILEIPKDKILKKVNVSRKKNGPFRPVRIKENLTLDEVQRLKMLRFVHSGLDIQQTIVRHYVLNDNGAQLFGYVGEISKSKLSKYRKRYPQFTFEQGDIIGKNGLEQIWERRIRGLDGISLVEVDARGRLAPTESPGFFNLKNQDPVPGNNLILTIDKDVQRAAFESMQKEHKGGARIGSVVAMKSNGEILAWVVAPSYNPNEFSTGISKELWGELSNDPYKPLRNKVIQDHYPPGSTLKPLIALAALQENIIKEDTIIYAPSRFKFGRRIYHDHSRAGHGNINVLQAIERSSNVFFYKMGISLGIDKMHRYMSLFGLGQSTGIKIPNETRGNFPSEEWKKKVYGEAWQSGENLSTAIGQGYVLATSLQMAIAYNTIALEGKVYKPFVLQKIISPDGELVFENKPQLIRDISEPREKGPFPETVIDKKVFKIVNKGMWRVANGDRGTARWWKIPGVEMAGKTGTSQVMSFSADQIYKDCYERPMKQRHHGTYVAFAPYEKPEITVAVHIEHGCHGNTAGSPVARDIIQAYMKKYYPERIAKGVEEQKARWRRMAKKKKEEEALKQQEEAAASSSEASSTTEESGDE